jgi:hypothetical protein
LIRISAIHSTDAAERLIAKGIQDLQRDGYIKKKPLKNAG